MDLYRITSCPSWPSRAWPDRKPDVETVDLGPLLPHLGPLLPQPGPLLPQPGPLLPQPVPLMPHLCSYYSISHSCHVLALPYYILASFCHILALSYHSLVQSFHSLSYSCHVEQAYCLPPLVILADQTSIWAKPEHCKSRASNAAMASAKVWNWLAFRSKVSRPCSCS